MATRLAETWGGINDGAWSAIDVVTQNRRLCVNAGLPEDLRRLERIEATVAAAWNVAMTDFEAGGAVRSNAALRALGVLTERFPAPPIHAALLGAITRAGSMLSACDDSSRESLRSMLGPILVRAWHRTLDKASRTAMFEALSAWSLYDSADAFTGLIWAWRFDTDRAVDYLLALQNVCETTPEVDVDPLLVLPDDDELATFEMLLAQRLPTDAGHPRWRHVRMIVETIFHSRDFGHWHAWLDAALIGPEAKTARAAGPVPVYVPLEPIPVHDEEDNCVY